MKEYISEGRARYEDNYHGLFSKKLAEFAIANMRVKDAVTNTMRVIKVRPAEEVMTLLANAGHKLQDKYTYTAWYLFNMAVADYPKALPTDEARTIFVYETLFDPDSCPESVLECYTAKMCIRQEPIFWEQMI